MKYFLTTLSLLLLSAVVASAQSLSYQELNGFIMSNNYKAVSQQIIKKGYTPVSTIDNKQYKWTKYMTKQKNDHTVEICYQNNKVFQLAYYVQKPEEFDSLLHIVQSNGYHYRSFDYTKLSAVRQFYDNGTRQIQFTFKNKQHPFIPYMVVFVDKATYHQTKEKTVQAPKPITPVVHSAGHA